MKQQFTRRKRREQPENAQPNLTRPVTQKLWLLSVRKLLAKASSADRSFSGVYFLFCGDEIVYVGQSVNILGRVYSHKAEGTKTFDRWSHVLCEPNELLRLERAYINKFLPRYNLDNACLVKKAQAGLWAALPDG